jgi:hypothetical protein
VQKKVNRKLKKFSEYLIHEAVLSGLLWSPLSQSY